MDKLDRYVSPAETMCLKPLYQYSMSPSFSPSDYYPDEEREKDKLMMEEHFGWKLPKFVASVRVLVRVCTRDAIHRCRDENGNVIKNAEGKEIGIIIPDDVRKHDNYSSNVGLVCAMGEYACRDTSTKYYGAKFKIGDYVTFPPSAGLLTPWKGLSFKLINDNHVDMIVEDPMDLLIPLTDKSK